MLKHLCLLGTGSDHVADLLIPNEHRQTLQASIWPQSADFVTDLENLSATAKSSQKLYSVILP